jgi:hypothetical protein
VAVRAMSTSRPTGYRSQEPDIDVAPTGVAVASCVTDGGSGRLARDAARRRLAACQDDETSNKCNLSEGGG